MAVVGLQFQPLRAARAAGFHCLVSRERLEQRLRLRDLRKLRRRRKAFQRGRQDVVGVDGAARGLVELGQRQRGAQLEAAGLLLLRDGDGGEEGGFGGGGVGGVLFEEDFAADAMESGVEPMLSGLARQRQRFVDAGEGGFRVSPLGFDFREQPLIERQRRTWYLDWRIRPAPVEARPSRRPDRRASRAPRPTCTAPKAR